MNRFLRPEPANIVSNEPNSSSNGGRTESGAAGRGVGEERPRLASSGAALEDVDLGPDEEYRTQLSVGSEAKPSEDGESMREELFCQAGNDITPRDEAERICQGLSADGQVESQEEDEFEEHVKTRSIIITDNAVSKGMKEETQRAVTPDDPEKEDETVTEVQANEDNEIHHFDIYNTEIELCTIADLDENEEDNMLIEEAREQRSDAGTELMHEDVEKSRGFLQLASKNKDESEDDEKAGNQGSVCTLMRENHTEDTGQGDGRDVAEEEQEMKSEKILDEEQDEEENIQTQDEESEQEGEDILTESVTCSKVFKQFAETELHTTEEEEEDVAQDTEVQTKTREPGGVGAEDDQKSDADVSVKKISFYEDQVGEDNTESYMGIASRTTSITVKPEDKSGQETIRELKNMCEGRVVVSQELNSPTCGETQEGVPEYNNEPEPDENTTQRFLEVENCEEIQTTQLPEEVESGECESVQERDCSPEADKILMKEHREEERENKELTGVLYLTDMEESGRLFEEEDRGLLVHSMKTEIERSDEDLETHGSADEIDETTTEQHDRTEEVLVTFGVDDGLTGLKYAAADVCVAAEQALGFTNKASKILDAEVEKMSEILNSDQNCSLTPSLRDDQTESGFLEDSVETEPGSVEHCAVDMENAAIEETDSELEEEAAEDEMTNKNEMGISHLHLVESAVEEMEKELENKSAVSAESLDDGFDISNEDILRDSEAAEESLTTDFPSVEEMAKDVRDFEERAEETSSSIGGHYDVIDEEILDLWIQAALPGATDDRKQQEGSEPGKPTVTEIEPSNEEQDEMTSGQTEIVQEQFVESDSAESGLVSDTEVSLLTAECMFLDQPLCEVDTENGESGPLKSSSAETFQEIYDMFAEMSESADISELSTKLFKSESQEITMDEDADQQSDLKDEELISNTEFQVIHQNQESDKSHEVESAQTEPGSQKENDAVMTEPTWETNWEITEEANAESLTRISSENVERTAAEDKPPAVAASGSPDKIEHSEFVQPTSGLEVLLDERVVLTESGSQGDTWTQLEIHSEWLEYIAESSPEDRTEVGEQLTPQFEDLTEVMFLSLTFNHKNIEFFNS